MVEVVFAVLAVVLVLALVSVLVPVAERLRLPHTVLLAVCGIALGFFASAVTGAGVGGIVADAFQGLRHLGGGATVFLSIFLPPLLFTAGLTIDVRRLLDEVSAVLLLAIVAVLVCIGAVGAIVNQAMGAGLIVCLLLGAIVSTTDPAAVIGVFRDVGAPKRLTILAEGESLFNDAAAIAAFGILIEILVWQTMPDAAAPGLKFLREFAGGIVVGFVLARAAVFVLPRLGADAAIASFTVGLAYVSYILSDRYLHVSGVVAVVVAALTLAGYGPTHLSPGSWTALKRTWHQLEFWANGLIFVLASMLAAEVLTRIQWIHLAGLGAVIVAAFGSRALVLFGLLPALVGARLVAPVATSYKTILVWGGLRGAVTVVLALVAAGDLRLAPEVTEFVAVLATLFVLFTLFVNAPTLRLLIGAFGLNRLSATQQAVRDRVLGLSRERVARDVATLRGAPPAAETAALAEPGPVLDVAKRVEAGLLTLCERERHIYLDLFAHRTLSRRLVAILTAGVDRLSDAVKTGGAPAYREAVHLQSRPDLRFRIAAWLYRRFGWEEPLADELADRFEALMVWQSILDELKRAAREPVRAVAGREAGDAISELMAERREAVDRALRALSLLYTSYAEEIRERHILQAEIRIEGAEYRRHLDDATISREVYESLEQALAERRAALDRRPSLRLGSELAAMISRVSLFSGCDGRTVSAVGRLLRPVAVEAGERIVAKGDPADAMFFIAAGRVVVHADVGRIPLGEGEFFGEMGLLSDRPRNADVVADGTCHLLALDKADFRRLSARQPSISAAIARVAAARGEPAAPGAGGSA